MKLTARIAATFERFGTRRRAADPAATATALATLLRADGSGAPFVRRAASLPPRALQRRASRVVLAASAAAALLLLILVASAGASKSISGYFGEAGTQGGQFESPNGIAVNNSGAGGVPPGTIYVADTTDNRIERFGPEGEFVAAWGFEVQTGGGAEYQVCTVAAECKAGINTTVPAPGGELSSPQSVAVDQATGQVYVGDNGFLRVQRFSAEGAWEEAFGKDTIVDGSASDPGSVTTLQTCTVAADCKEGAAGTAGGEFASTNFGYLAVAPAAAPNAGDVLIADTANNRVQELSGAGAFVRAFGYDTIISGQPNDTGTGFEECTVASECKAGAGTTNPPAGEFVTNQLKRVAEDSTGAIYTVENNTGPKPRRVQKFTPQVGPPALSAAVFANAILTSAASPPTDVAIGASDHVFVAKTFSSSDRRVLELDSSGNLIETHLEGSPVVPNGLALNTTNGRIYLSSNTEGKRVYVGDDVLPPVATISPVVDATAHTATLKGHVDTTGTNTTYRFEMSADGGSTWVPQTQQFTDLGSASADVEMPRVGLEANKVYMARLAAVKPFGAGSSTSSAVAFTTAPEAPLVSVAPIAAGAHSAVLHAIVNPQNSAVTSCFFEWGSSTAYGNTAPCEALPGAVGGPVLVSSEAIEGLETNTTYHFRLVATNSGGTRTGQDRSVTTGPKLPGNRAYEMVSPPEKNGNGVLADNSRANAAENGDAFQFSSLGAFAGAEGSGVATDYIAERSSSSEPGDNGWTTHAITPKQDSTSLFGIFPENREPKYSLFSPDLSAGVYTAFKPLSPTPNVEDVSTLWARRDLLAPGAGSYSLLSDSETALTQPFNSGRKPIAAGASDGLSHVVFESDSTYVPGAVEGGPNLYESTGGGLPRLVGMVPASGTSCTGGECVPASAGATASAPPSIGGGLYAFHVISTDGSRAVFTDTATEKLYLRTDGETTTQLNVVEGGSGAGAAKAHYWTASADDNRIFFTTSQALTPDDTNTGEDLYMYEVEAEAGHHLTLLSVDSEPRDGGAVSGVIGASEDGHWVYFVSNNQLVAGGPSIINPVVFLWHDGQLSFVGPMLGGDRLNIDVNENPAITTGGLRSRVTADGHELLYASHEAVGPTGYESGTCENNGFANQKCMQLYLYRADDSAPLRPDLACVTCLPSGAPFDSKELFSPNGGLNDTNVRYRTGGALTNRPYNHALSADGRYVFFSSAAPLSPEDTNGAADAYVYEVETGQQRLLSSGTSPEPSFFMDASANGSDAFILTSQKLVGWDTDGAPDVYDVRVGGGFPEPPPVPAACAGEDNCRGATPAAPAASSPASATLAGAGNPPKRRRCPKGRRPTRRHGKVVCLRRRHHRHRRHHRGRHHKRHANTNRRAGR